jgi:hypothetical protein
MSRSSITLAVLVVATIVGCRSPSGRPGVTDAGRALDGGPVVPIDAGGLDAGSVDASRDAAPPDDAGPVADASDDAGALDASPGCPALDLGSMVGVALASGTTVGAGDDVSPSCADSTSEDVSYRWTAPRTASFTFDTLDSSFDTVLSVRAVDCSGVELDCNDDDFELLSRVDLMLTMGTVVTVTVDGYDVEAGDYVLSITEAPAGERSCTNAVDDDRDGATDCSDPDCAADPACGMVAPAPSVAGDVVITEVMQNPAGTDAGNEWLELHNPTGTAFNLRGCVLSDLDTDSHSIVADVSLPAGGYVALASGASPGFTPAYTYAGYTLANGADEVVVTCGGTEIDRVAYDGGPMFPSPDGASTSLDPSALTAAANDAGSNWCASPAPAYAGTNRGTPGAANPTCP